MSGKRPSSVYGLMGENSSQRKSSAGEAPSETSDDSTPHSYDFEAGRLVIFNIDFVNNAVFFIIEKFLIFFFRFYF